MSVTAEITGELYADAQLILFLENHDYTGLLKFIDAQYGLKFVIEQTGASFEDCLDWCAQNAGSIDDARHVLRLLFERYYLQLPRPVQADLLYLAEEVGYGSRRTRLDELKSLCRAQFKRGGATRDASLTRLARLLLSNMRLKLKEHSLAAPWAARRP